MKTKEDFLANPEFIAWVKQPNQQLDNYWTKWISANPEQVGQLKMAREILLRVRFNKFEAPKGLREDVLQQLLRESKPKEEIENFPLKKYHTFSWQNMGQLYRIAAILILSFGLGMLLSPSASDPTQGMVAKDTTWIEKITQPGEKLQLTLEDGSRIWLNANSNLIFPEKFNSLQRTVKLIGEAYFEVQKDSLRPFNVETNGLVTTVLGTTFNINNTEAGSIAISLVSGSVKVTEKSSDVQVLLKPGEALHHDTLSGKQERSSFDPNLVVSWKDGWIRFDRASLEQVLKTLENWYGVEFRLQGSKPLAWHFSGEYKKQTLEEVLSSMAYIKGFEFSIDENIVQLKF
jgi:ferric-dicitrate binding protein FerR (iron transport regulator)